MVFVAFDHPTTSFAKRAVIARVVAQRTQRPMTLSVGFVNHVETEFVTDVEEA